MNKDKSFELAQRWRKLASRAKELDWDKTLFSKDLRAEFSKGTAGDHELTRWCETELEMPQYVAVELLIRSRMAPLLSKANYETIGGFSAIRQVATLGKRDQVRVVQVAVAEQKAVRSVMRDLDLLPKQPDVGPNPDATLLAEFLANSGVDMPARVAKVVRKYTTARAGNHLRAVA